MLDKEVIVQLAQKGLDNAKELAYTADNELKAGRVAKFATSSKIIAIEKHLSITNERMVQAETALLEADGFYNNKVQEHSEACEVKAKAYFDNEDAENAFKVLEDKDSIAKNAVIDAEGIFKEAVEACNVSSSTALELATKRRDNAERVVREAEQELTDASDDLVVKQIEHNGSNLSSLSSLSGKKPSTVMI